MLFSSLGAFAVSFGLANAFKDTSPFFLFSTSELLTSTPNLVSAATISKTIVPQLEECPSDTYVIVSQPGVNAADYHNRFSTPHLRMKMLGNDKQIRSSIAVKDVIGIVDAQEISRLVQGKCEAGHLKVDASTGSIAIGDDVKPRVIDLDFPALPTSEGRASKLAENDAFLASVLDLLPSDKYTVIYTTTPSNAASHAEHAGSESYQMDTIFQAPLHMDLKRDLSSHKRANDDNANFANGPLFERYQFLSPGLFMGILVSIILLSILYVGITGVASLQVSYAAFDKEMGPTAQKNKAQ